MDKVTFFVFFQDPFWVGLLERITDQGLSACKITFGPEPKDYEVKKFLLENYDKLKLSPAVETTVKEMQKNPKRMQREVKRQIANVGMGTKSQQALKLQHEEAKQERKQKSKEVEEAEKQLKFDKYKQKKKEKHRGR